MIGTVLCLCHIPVQSFFDLLDSRKLRVIRWHSTSSGFCLGMIGTVLCLCQLFDSLTHDPLASLVELLFCLLHEGIGLGFHVVNRLQETPALLQDCNTSRRRFNHRIIYATML